MDTQPVTPPKPTLTAEQRRTLGRVYKFLIETGQKRLQRLAQENQKANPADEIDTAEKASPTSD